MQKFVNLQNYDYKILCSLSQYYSTKNLNKNMTDTFEISRG